MLEKMAAFFEARLEGYDQHMLNDIESARCFYPYTAMQLPDRSDAKLLDLGCGTGLELEYYLPSHPAAQITCVDLSEGMLNALKRKLGQYHLSLIRGSYFDVSLECESFDAAVSVESLHHFTQAEKIPLYQKLHRSLKPNGYFILTDYFASNDEDEKNLRSELIRLKREQHISNDEFYHFDTPLTVANETHALLAAGFSKVEHLNFWGNTHTLKASK